MKARGVSFFLLFLLFLGLFGIIESFTFSHLEAMALPLVMSSLIFVLSAVELGRQGRGQHETQKGDQGEKTRAGVEWRRFGLTSGWLLGFFIGIYLFGFLIAIPVFAFLYIRLQGKRWLAVVIVTAFTLAFVYGFFEVGLKTPLYEGLIFGGR